ncbi:MAG: ABC transporter permease, partial [Sulfitobacter geojensis]
MRLRDILFAVLIGLGLWQAAVILTNAPHFILPSPWRVAQAAYHSRAIIAQNAWVTTIEVCLGLLIGTVLGVVTAIQLSMSKTAVRLMLPILVFMDLIGLWTFRGKWDKATA